MNILVLFYIVFLSRLCSSADSRDGGNNGSTGTLVSKLDGSKYNVSASNSNGVPVLQCKPRSGVLANELKYGGETIWDGKGKVQVLLALIYFKGDKPEVVTLQCKENDKNPTLFLHKDGSKWVDCKEEHERKLKGLQNAAKSEESDEEEDATNDGQDDVPAYTAEEIEEFKKHLIKLASKVDKTVVKVDGVTEDNLFALKLTPKDEKAVTQVKYDDKEVWSGGGLFSKSNLVEAIIYFYKEIPALVNIKVVKGGKESTVYRYYDARGFWCDSEEEQFNKFLEDTKKQVETIKAKEAEKAAQEESTSQDASSSDSQPSGEQEDVSQQISPEATGQESAEPAEPEQLLNPFLDKVDTSLFDIEEAEEDTVKVLKLKEKDGVKATEVNYDGQRILSGWKLGSCPSALLYMDQDRPTLAVVDFQCNGNVTKVYRYHDGKQWKDGNESNHKKKLELLKEKYKPRGASPKTPTTSEPATEESPVVKEAPKSADLSQGQKPADKPVESSTSKPSEPKGASPEAPRDLPDHIPEHPQEFEDEEADEKDEDPSFNDDDDWDGPLSQEQEEDDDPDLEPEPERRPRKSRNSTRRESNAYKSRGSSEKLPEDEDSELNDGFWDTPDDYSERQGDTQDEPDGLVIEEVEDDEVEDIGEEEEDEKEEVEEPENSSGSPVSIDIAQPSSACRRFEYIYEDNHVRLLIPYDGSPVVKMFDGRTVLWEVASNQIFEFAKIYLNKYNKPELVLVATTTDSSVLYTRFKRTSKGWESCKDYSNEVNKLKIASEANNPFTIHLENKNDTNECTTFEARMIDLYTQCFFPKPGYIAKEVMYNGVTLWKSTNGNEKCIGCDLYPRGHGRPLLAITIQGRTKDYKFFEKEGSRWVPVKNEEFSEKLERMKIAKGESLKDLDETNEPEGQDMNIPEPPEEEATDYLLDEDEEIAEDHIDNEEEEIIDDPMDNDENEQDEDEEEEEDEPPSQEVNMTRNYSRSTGGSSDRVDASPPEVKKPPNSPREAERKVTKDREIKDQPVEVENNTDREQISAPTIHKETEETSRAQRVPANHVNNNVQMQKNINCRETANYNNEATVRTRYGKVNNPQRSDKSTNTDNFEDQLEWTDVVGALRGNRYTAHDANIMSMSRERELFGKMDYTDSRDLFNAQPYLGDGPMEQIYVEPRDNFTYYPPNFMVPDKGPCTVCAMRRMITPLFFPTFQSDTVINVSKYNPTFYNLYDYHFDDIITRLIIPWKGVTMTRLMNGRRVIWNSREGESLVYATIHLRETVPVLVYILKNSPSVNKTETMLRTNHGWRLIGNYPGAFKSIPRPDVVKFHCTIDLTCPDHGRIKVFDTVIGGLKTRFFIPRLGFRADKITHKGTILWRSPESEDSGKESQWRAILVRAYLRGNSCFLVKATLKETGDSLSSVNYIYLNGRWIEIDERESERAKWALKAYVDPQE